MVLNGSKLTLIEIADYLAITNEHVEEIVHEILDKQKLFTKRVSFEFTIDRFFILHINENNDKIALLIAFKFSVFLHLKQNKKMYH